MLKKLDAFTFCEMLPLGLVRTKKRRDVCQHLPMIAIELLNTFLYLDIFGWSYLVLRMRDGPLTILKRLLCLEKALQQ